MKFIFGMSLGVTIICTICLGIGIVCGNFNIGEPPTKDWMVWFGIIIITLLWGVTMSMKP